MIKIETKVLFQERVMVMALAQATKSHEPTYTINDAMDVLLSDVCRDTSIVYRKVDESARVVGRKDRSRVRKKVK